MDKKKALIAMSGGVDSSVSAVLMAQAGYDCVGVNMKLHAGAAEDAIGVKTCCSLTDAEDALEALGELTGRTAREEIVGRIFSRFCVGK